LRARGVAEPDAGLVAEVGIAVFRIAFAQWVDPAERRSYGEIVDGALTRLRTLAA
ncbi:TetR family transcriptional regulator, partial [Xanthomonas sp. Kuri4-2]